MPLSVCLYLQRIYTKGVDGSDRLFRAEPRYLLLSSKKLENEEVPKGFNPCRFTLQINFLTCQQRAPFTLSPPPPPPLTHSDVLTITHADAGESRSGKKKTPPIPVLTYGNPALLMVSSFCT